MLKKDESMCIGLECEKVPAYEGALELMTLGVYSSIFVKNLQSFAEK